MKILDIKRNQNSLIGVPCSLMKLFENITLMENNQFRNIKQNQLLNIEQGVTIEDIRIKTYYE